MKYLFVLLLAGCATPEKVWYRAGGTDQQFEMDKGQCQAQAFGATGMYSMQVALIYNSCMRGRGWQLVDAK